LYKGGAIQLMAQEKFGEQFMCLSNKDIYSQDVGITWDDPSFKLAESLVIS
jgi:hypothetical protein